MDAREYGEPGIAAEQVFGLTESRNGLEWRSVNSVRSKARSDETEIRGDAQSSIMR